MNLVMIVQFGIALRLSPQSLIILRKMPESNSITNHLLFRYGYLILLFENLVTEAALFIWLNNHIGI